MSDTNTINTSIAITDETDNGAFIPSHLDDLGLSPFEFRLYAHIARRAGSGGQCWEGIDKMAKICKMERKTAYKAFQFLEDHKMIRVERKKGSTSHITLTNRAYWIPPDQEVVSDRPTRPPHPLKGTSKKKNSGCAENGIGAGCTLNGIPPVPQTGHLPMPETEQPPIPNTEQPPIPNTVHKGTPLEGTPIEGSPSKEKERADDFFVNSSSTQIQENLPHAQNSDPNIRDPQTPKPLSPVAPENPPKKVYADPMGDRFKLGKKANRYQTLISANPEWGFLEDWGGWEGKLVFKESLIKAQQAFLKGNSGNLPHERDNAISSLAGYIFNKKLDFFEQRIEQALKLEAAEAIAAQQRQAEQQRFEQPEDDGERVDIDKIRAELKRKQLLRRSQAA